MAKKGGSSGKRLYFLLYVFFFASGVIFGNVSIFSSIRYVRCYLTKSTRILLFSPGRPFLHISLVYRGTYYFSAEHYDNSFITWVLLASYLPRRGYMLNFLWRTWVGTFLHHKGVACLEFFSLRRPSALEPDKSGLDGSLLYLFHTIHRTHDCSCSHGRCGSLPVSPFRSVQNI